MDKTKPPQELKELFERISSGKATASDTIKFSQWLNQLDIEQGPSRARLRERRREFQDYFRDARVQSKKAYRLKRRWLPAIAASIVLLFAGTWTLHIIQNKAVDDKSSFQATTAPNQRKTISLQDGSMVTLNPASIIQIHANFGIDSREITLDGEAFFDVTPRADKPFIIHASGIQVKVLGTSFNVNSYRQKDINLVTVSTGKVEVTTGIDQQSWTLVQGDELTYYNSTNEVKINKKRGDEVSGRAIRELVFTNQPLAAICETLEQKFGVTITIQSEEIRNKRINLRLRNEDLKTIIKLLSQVGEFHYRIAGKKIEIW
ncbi:MAG: FecR family protein [Sphingobacterium sp.]